MSKWNFVAMGQVGPTGWTREVAKPAARSIARRTGRPEAQILSLIGAAFLATTLSTSSAMSMPSSRRGAPAVSQRTTLPPPTPRTARPRSWVFSHSAGRRPAREPDPGG